jgi:hypothetical protein
MPGLSGFSHAAQDRLGHRPDVDLRIELAAHAFDVEQVFCSRINCGCRVSS